MDKVKIENVEHNMPPTFSFDKINQIINNYEAALIRIGIDVRGKDLLEVIAELADELNNTKAELRDLKNEVHNKSYSTDKELEKKQK